MRRGRGGNTPQKNKCAERFVCIKSIQTQLLLVSASLVVSSVLSGSFVPPPPASAPPSPPPYPAEGERKRVRGSAAVLPESRSGAASVNKAF